MVENEYSKLKNAHYPQSILEKMEEAVSDWNDSSSSRADKRTEEELVRTYLVNSMCFLSVVSLKDSHLKAILPSLFKKGIRGCSFSISRFL